MRLFVTFVAVTILFKSSLFAALSGRLKSTLLRNTGYPVKQINTIRPTLFHTQHAHISSEQPQSIDQSIYNLSKCQLTQLSIEESS